jgi:hypothetical protein
MYVFVQGNLFIVMNAHLEKDALAFFIIVLLEKLDFLSIVLQKNSYFSGLRFNDRKLRCYSDPVLVY